jgi:predicted DNA-binding transcriptional regulator AlpA
MTTLVDEDFLGPQDLCKITGWKVGTVHNRLSKGEDLPEYVKVGKNVRFPKSAVEAWLQKNLRVPAAVQLQQHANA